jgi:phage pi2 protein 07
MKYNTLTPEHLKAYNHLQDLYGNKIKVKDYNETIDDKGANDLSRRLGGKFLLQVEQGGAIWYVDTKEYKRYSVTFANALSLFRKLSLGISNTNLAKIPIAKSGQIGDLSTRNRLKGKFLLQVEQGGAIWYVDHDGYRHSVTWDNLLPLFQSLALGVTNENLNKIFEGSL